MGDTASSTEGGRLLIVTGVSDHDDFVTSPASDRDLLPVEEHRSHHHVSRSPSPKKRRQRSPETSSRHESSSKREASHSSSRAHKKSHHQDRSRSRSRSRSSRSKPAAQIRSSGSFAPATRPSSSFDEMSLHTSPIESFDSGARAWHASATATSETSFSAPVDHPVSCVSTSDRTSPSARNRCPGDTLSSAFPADLPPAAHSNKKDMAAMFLLMAQKSRAMMVEMMSRLHKAAASMSSDTGSSVDTTPVDSRGVDVDRPRVLDTHQAVHAPSFAPTLLNRSTPGAADPLFTLA